MKYLSLIPVAIFLIALQAQTGGTVQSGQPAVAAASVSGELTKRIDTKKAKVGDEVDVRTTSTAKLADGTELPRGTKLVGKVTDVRANSKTDKSSHIAFDLDHAVMRDGKEMPVHAAVTSMMAPAQPADNAMMLPGGGSGNGGGGSMGAGAGAGASAQAANVPIMSTNSNQSGAQIAKGPQDRVPVANLPGVVLTSADGVSSTGALDATNQNISLDSGTKMTLNVLASR